MQRHVLPWSGCVLFTAAAFACFVPAARGAAAPPPHVAPQAARACPFPLESCLAYYADFRERGWVGMTVEADEKTGATRVLEVFPDAPAAAAGIRPGDVLLAVDGARFGDDKALNQAKAGWRIGTTSRYSVSRDGGEIQLRVARAAVPEDLLALWTGRHVLEGHLAAHVQSIR